MPINKLQAKRNNYRAYSLLELLIVIALLTIILLLAIPSWQLLFHNNAAFTYGNKIIAALEYTRIAAIKQNQNISFCRNNSSHFGDEHNWSFGQKIKNAKTKKTLRIFDAVRNGDMLLWRSSLSKNDCITFTPLGNTYGQQGSFYYCLKKATKEKEENLQTLEITVQEAGRIHANLLIGDKAKAACE